MSTEASLAEEARHRSVRALAQAGDWLTGAQRIDAWAETRRADTHPIDRARKAAVSPEAVVERFEPTAHLPAAAVDVVHRVASDPGRLSRRWAEERIAELGPEVYTELVGVTSIARALDTFATAIGDERSSLPRPVAGDPLRIRPDDVGDVGAWVPQTVGKTRANVSRALSLVPETNRVWRELEFAHYSRGSQFMELVWDRSLTRVQIEAVAARTTSELDCFY